MNFYEWANRWGVPGEAIEELRAALGMIPDPKFPPASDQSEAAVQKRAMLAAGRQGARLFRNNVGACMDENGNFIRYGLANESKQMNDRFKSSDLIGIRQQVVGPEMVGRVVGVFFARECKPSGWTYTGTAREVAQLRFIQLINVMGGDAAFTNGQRETRE